MKCTSILLVVFIVAIAFPRGLPLAEPGKLSSSQRESYIAEGVLGALMSEGLIRADEVDLSKTQTTQLGSRKLGKHRCRHVYSVDVFRRNGENVATIAIYDEAPEVEQSGLVVDVVSKVLQPDGKPTPPQMKVGAGE
jgi:hypothetical protein